MWRLAHRVETMNMNSCVRIVSGSTTRTVVAGAAPLRRALALATLAVLAVALGSACGASPTSTEAPQGQATLSSPSNNAEVPLQSGSTYTLEGSNLTVFPATASPKGAQAISKLTSKQGDQSGIKPMAEMKGKVCCSGCLCPPPGGQCACVECHLCG
jgi:hypothetical protein